MLADANLFEGKDANKNAKGGRGVGNVVGNVAKESGEVCEISQV